MNNIQRSIILALTLITSCQKSKKIDINQVIAQAKANFPVYQKQKLDFIRSVKIGPLNTQVHLYSTDNKYGKDKLELIVIENSNYDFYAIPLPSNSYQNYWNFEYEKASSGIDHSKTTFANELNIATKNLSPQDKNLITTEIFLSLLQCQLINENDSANLKSLTLVDKFDLKEENTDSCWIRIEQNWKDIYSAIRPNEHTLHLNSFLDKKNHRVYLIPGKSKEEKSQKLNIKIYRQDCIYHLMTL